MLTRLAVIVFVVIGLHGYGAGCVVSSDFSGTAFLCSETSRCPTGQQCFDGRCRFAPIDASPVDAETTTGSPIGDLLTYTFDEPTISMTNLSDRSGHGHHGFGPDAREPGKSGMALRLFRDASALYHIPYYKALHPSVPLTIEMWLKRDQTGVAETILSDAISAAEPRYLSLGISAEAHPVFSRRDGCNGMVHEVIGMGATIAANTWVHLAVTHDGEQVEFYVDGVLSATEKLSAAPCDSPSVRSLRIGTDRDDNGRPFAGLIDEFKLSTRVKNQADIQASMTFTLAEVCGDRLVEMNEVCEPDALCCLASCTFDTVATPCGDGDIGNCSDGRCKVPAARSNKGLVTQYAFGEGMGTKIGDSLGILPLTIADLTNVTWTGKGLTISGPVSITSISPATKLIETLKGTNELTIEAWLTPAVFSAIGPTRVVTLSVNSSSRNFLLGQEKNTWVSRIRTAISSDNGIPALFTAEGDAPPGLHHVVATYTSGQSSLYVDGRLRASFPLSGGFSRWVDSFQLAIGDELDGDRTWRGTFHHLAIFSRALTATDVAKHFAFGVPKPGVPL